MVVWSQRCVEASWELLGLLIQRLVWYSYKLMEYFISKSHSGEYHRSVKKCIYHNNKVYIVKPRECHSFPACLLACFLPSYHPSTIHQPSNHSLQWRDYHQSYQQQVRRHQDGLEATYLQQALRSFCGMERGCMLSWPCSVPAAAWDAIPHFRCPHCPCPAVWYLPVTHTPVVCWAQTIS